MKKQNVLRLASLMLLALTMNQPAHAGDFLQRLANWFNQYYNDQANGDRCYSQLNAKAVGAGKVYAEWATGKTYEDDYVDPRLVPEMSAQSPNDNTANNTLSNSTAQHKYVFFAVAESGWKYEGVYKNAECTTTYSYEDSKLSDDGGRCAARVIIPTSNTSGRPGEVLNLFARFSLDVNINARGYSTLYYSNYNFKVPTGITATTYKLDSNGKLQVSTAYHAGSVIPAGEAVVLEGTASTTYKFIPVTGTYTKDGNNILRGSDEAEETTGGTKYYALSYNSTKGVVGFYWMKEGGAAFTNGAHKAYLALGGTSSDVKGFDLEGDDATGISNVDANANGAIYNLAGQRVGKMQKGINIVNGKKILVK